MQYFVKIHIPTGTIEGYIEDEPLNKIQRAYENDHEDVCKFYLAQGSRYDSDRVSVSINPRQIIAIESKFIR